MQIAHLFEEKSFLAACIHKEMQLPSPNTGIILQWRERQGEIDETLFAFIWLADIHFHEGAD